MYSDGMCNPECNIDECAYDGGDCTVRQQTSSCLKQQEASLTDLSGPYLEDGQDYYEAELSIHFRPLQSYTNHDTGNVIFVLEFSHSIKFADPRLSTSPCFGALQGRQSILSITETESSDSSRAQMVRDARKFFFYPELRITNEYLVDAGEESLVNGILPSQHQLQHFSVWGGGGNKSVCYNCVTINTSRRNVKLEQSWKFDFFPFDTPQLTFFVSLDLGNISTACSGLARTITRVEDWDRSVPTWELSGEEAIRSSMVRDNLCRVDILLSRRYTVFMIKQLLAIIIIVWGALLTLRVEPRSPPLFGGRISGLIFAMVIVMLQPNLAVSLLGNLTYLVWSDVFSLCQFSVLVIALCCSVHIHGLIRADKEEYAMWVDKIVRECTSSEQAIWTGALALGVFVVCFLSFLAYTAFRRDRELRRVATRLRDLRGQSESEEAQALLRSLFHRCEVYNTGYISLQVVRHLLHEIYPLTSRSKLRQITHSLSSSEISFEQFQEAYEQLSTLDSTSPKTKHSSCGKLAREPVICTHLQLFKPLRTVLDPLVWAQLKKYDLGDYVARVTSALQQQAKQGTIQQWVRDCDTISNEGGMRVRLLQAVLQASRVAQLHPTQPAQEENPPCVDHLVAQLEESGDAEEGAVLAERSEGVSRAVDLGDVNPAIIEHTPWVAAVACEEEGLETGETSIAPQEHMWLKRNSTFAVLYSMSLDSHEITSMAPSELMSLIKHGFTSIPITEPPPLVTPTRRLRPRSQLPLLYASDGSLHQGRAATAAHGFRHVPKFPELSSDRAITAPSDQSSVRSPNQHTLPSHASSLPEGAFLLGWDHSSEELEPFSKVDMRRKQAAANRRIALMTQEAQAKRQWLLDSARSQILSEWVDTPQFAAKRELPPSYTKPHDLQMLAQARSPGGLLDLRPTNVKTARSRRRGNLDFQPLEIYSDPKERRESSLCIGRSISLKRLEQGNALPTSAARTPSPMMSWSISSKWNKVLPKCKSSLRATIT
ncbi:MAG: hypothetical protein SGPRY_003331 [Prymnesium sp.]